MSWTTLADTLFGTGKKIAFDLMKALRDNPLAIAAGMANAPVNQAHWHPYNRANYADANTGVIYDFAVTGAITQLTTPDFADGYEYQIGVFGLAVDSWNIQLYNPATASYTATQSLAGGGGLVVEGLVNLADMRAAVVNHIVENVTLPQGAPLYKFVFSSAQKALRARLNFTGGGGTSAGRIVLYRRLAPYVG